ncbi:hypothetical protein [Nonomuraea soli]|uniref:Uncharacterized protein n=1 Tax=Nonomuraea soli TaxID=1032476 RepID=A0A7W0HMF1_9ACTN|nr:hypothetical protein [Nonomuraea soli]MBA2888685.1 hypothetical protein [Nonomuraea soli]
MNWGPTGTVDDMVTFDPEGLSSAQRFGDACVVCHKKWPRPRVRVGRLPDESAVMACTDCAEALFPAPLATVVAFPLR